MLSLALTLQLFGAEPARVPALHFIPPLALSSEHARPDLAVPLPWAESPEVHVRVGAVAAASAGILLADLATATVMVWGLSCFVEGLFEGGASCDAGSGILLMLAGTAGFLFVPPAAGVYGARLAGEQGDAGRRAYWIAFAVRLASMLAASSLSSLNEAAATAAFVATEFVVVPYVIARVLAAAPRPTPGPAPTFAVATPERDPALPLARIR